MEDSAIRQALAQAKNGAIAVLVYHGVPDVYPHCSTPLELFSKDMQYLKDAHATVIALASSVMGAS